MKLSTEGDNMHVDLKAIDRCDRCSAAARAVAEFEAGEILLCGHHWRKHRAAIVEIAKSYYVEPDQEDFTIQKQKDTIDVAG